jgi:hypothetical protein
MKPWVQNPSTAKRTKESQTLCTFSDVLSCLHMACFPHCTIPPQSAGTRPRFLNCLRLSEGLGPAWFSNLTYHALFALSHMNPSRTWMKWCTQACHLRCWGLSSAQGKLWPVGGESWADTIVSSFLLSTQYTEAWVFCNTSNGSPTESPSRLIFKLKEIRLLESVKLLHVSCLNFCSVIYYKANLEEQKKKTHFYIPHCMMAFFFLSYALFPNSLDFLAPWPLFRLHREPALRWQVGSPKLWATKSQN